MIELITGLPGAGKSQMLLSTVHARAQREARTVFYAGIRLTPRGEEVLGWRSLEDGVSWETVPDGSVVVLDECQRVFPVRPSGSVVPSHVQALETHRHRGIDLVLATQHPHLVDTHVRKLVERHRHLVRPFGYGYSKIYEWQSCNSRPESSVSHKEAISSRQKFRRDVWTWYESAVAHTHQSRFPKFLFWLPFMALLVVALVWWSLSSLSGDDAVTVPPSSDVGGIYDGRVAPSRDVPVETVRVVHRVSDTAPGLLVEPVSLVWICDGCPRRQWVRVRSGDDREYGVVTLMELGWSVELIGGEVARLVHRTGRIVWGYPPVRHSGDDRALPAVEAAEDTNRPVVRVQDVWRMGPANM